MSDCPCVVCGRGVLIETHQVRVVAQDGEIRRAEMVVLVCDDCHEVFLDEEAVQRLDALATFQRWDRDLGPWVES